MNNGIEIDAALAPPPPPDQEITHLGDDAKARELPDGLVVLLRVIEGAEVGRGYPIHKLPVTIGRDALCDISITDGRLSRQHAMVFFYSPNFFIKDLGSTNGTFLNDKRIKQEVLHNGAHIKIGSTVLEFIFSEQSGAAV